MISHIEANALLDCYGALLTPRQQEICALVFQDDLSLSEVQETLGISRAAVSDAIHKAVRSMESFEEKLHLCAKHRHVLNLIEQYPQMADALEVLL